MLAVIKFAPLLVALIDTLAEATEPEATRVESVPQPQPPNLKTEDNISVTQVEPPINTPEIKPDKKEAINSILNVVDYITDVVADKVSRNVTTSQIGDDQQNGFDSVKAVAEIMGSSRGGKRNKTHKFKLTRHTKTKKTKTRKNV